jgi:glycosidase
MENLGVSTLWLNPVVENNMQDYSYHGYAITDFYQVDPRYGSNQQYRQLSDELHQRNMKLVMDMVFNHCGLEHWWIKEPPFSDWIHHHPEYTNTNHAIGAVSDPYAVQSDLIAMEEGWFVPTMPDLNHDNQFLANYLIQNSIWWIEFARLDGIRMDTYPYNKPATMVEWVERVENEYPGFFLLGETWVHNEPQEAFWASKNPEKTNELNTKLQSITDFPLTYGIHKAFGKVGNVEALYDVLNKDFLYYQPFDNTIFADNHDMDRIFYTLNEDLEKFKMAMTFLFTTRGFPQLYYGTEILMKGSGDHGIIREEFPGGWSGDERNAFAVEGRSAAENEAFSHIQNLLKWRKTSDAIRNGNLKHYKPTENIYVMSRASDQEKVVVVFNNKNQSQEINREDYAEVFMNADEAMDIISGKTLSNLNQIEIPANSALLLQLKGDNLESMK